MKRFVICMLALCVAGAMVATAQEAAPAAVEKAAAAELTLTGKIVKEAPKAEGAKATFVLLTKDGAKIALPETKAEVADLEKLVDKDVKVTAKGTGEGKDVKVASIIKVEEVPAAPAETK